MTVISVYAPTHQAAPEKKVHLSRIPLTGYVQIMCCSIPEWEAVRGKKMIMGRSERISWRWEDK